VGRRRRRAAVHRRAGDVTAASDDVVAGEHVNDELLIGCGGLRDGDVTGQVRGAVVGSALEAERTVYAAATLHSVPDVTQRDLLPTHTHTHTHTRTPFHRLCRMRRSEYTEHGM